MKSRTTGKATSASSRAMRTSRNMSATLDSVMRACPLRVLTRRESLSVRAEAMGESRKNRLSVLAKPQRQRLKG